MAKKVIPEKIINNCGECDYDCNIPAYIKMKHQINTVCNNCPLGDYREEPTKQLYILPQRKTLQKYYKDAGDYNDGIDAVFSQAKEIDIDQMALDCLKFLTDNGYRFPENKKRIAELHEEFTKYIKQAITDYIKGRVTMTVNNLIKVIDSEEKK